PETSIMTAMSTAEKLRNETEKYAFPHVGKITASFGVTQFIYGDTETSFINRADEALYKAKRSGRNRVDVLSSSLIIQPVLSGIEL
ncbi:MAG: diguanylate cyclase, partial [Gammaproteobacteria bacterium]|nr:diguanylate cyclase [Gammaproteobacteria bacterium]